jgi:predicted nucleic acid-binding protein
LIAYLDSSVVLRLVLGEPGRLGEWEQIGFGVASALVQVECLRTLDRLRLQNNLSVEETSLRREAVFRMLEGVELVDVTGEILDRAAQPFPAPIGTLDAVHLATALAWREVRKQPLVMATHDAALAVAARSCGLKTVGTAGGAAG